MGKREEKLTGKWEGQQVVEIPIDSLVLWSENPRDPISADADNFEIINNALHGARSSKVWNLDNLAADMGSAYDYSDLPTVVYDERRKKYVVYDGNRRIAIAMIRRHGIPGLNVQLPLFPPDSIPCNVCDRGVAIKNVYRKHRNSGSWSAYDRDVFANKYMGEAKSVLVRLEDLIEAVSKYPKLNQGYVRDDVLNAKHLREFGLDPDVADYGVSPDVLEDLVREIARGIDNGSIATRGKRNNPKQYIDCGVLERIESSRATRGVAKARQLPVGPVDPEGDSAETPSHHVEGDLNEVEKPARRTKTTKPKSYKVFGGILSLKCGDVNNLYRTLDELWRNFESGKMVSSEAFPGLFRAGLRLLVESAAHDLFQGNAALRDYINKYGADAWTSLRRQEKGNQVVTYLSNASVSKENLHSLLHTGAHSYSSSNNRDQALALSILVGAMLKLSHGK